MNVGDSPPTGSLSFPAFVDAWNARFGHETPDIHQEMSRWLQEQWDIPHRDLLLLAFRDSGKSSIVGLFCAWRLTEAPDTRILVLAAEEGLARRMVRTVKRVVETLRPDLKPPKPDLWGAEAFTILRPGVHRDPSMEAKGIGANATGCHADIVVCDDVEVPNTADTAAKRAELRLRLGELAHVLSPRGTLLYIGTPHHHHTIYAAHPRPGEAQEFLAGFSRKELPVYKDMDNRADPWWSDRFTPETLERIRLRSGEAKFQSQMLLVPRRLGDGRLDPNRLRRYGAEPVRQGTSPDATILLQGRPLLHRRAWWDPSLGTNPEKGRAGDGSALAILFIDNEGCAWLHRLVYLTVPEGEEPAQAQCRQVALLCREFHVRHVSVETNGIGNFLPGLLREALSALGETGISVQNRTARTGKVDRILDAWEPRLLSGTLWAHDTVFDTRLVQEMEEWRPDLADASDDGLDAVAGALRDNGESGTPGRKLRSPILALTDFAV